MITTLDCGCICSTCSGVVTPCQRHAPSAYLLQRIETLFRLIESERVCTLCEHPNYSGEHENDRHYNDCVFFLLRDLRDYLKTEREGK